MAVMPEEVRHIASLARLGLPDERLRSIAAELTTILGHMDVLSKVETPGQPEIAGVGAAGMPLRPDSGPPISLARSLETLAPRMKDGFLLVPRLSTHEDPEDT